MSFDPVFVEIYNAQTGISKLSAHELLVLLAKFRRSLSFNWIMSISENKQDMIRQVIITLLHLTEEKNTGIRLSAYSTMGTLILTVAPYSPLTFIQAFGDAITSLPVSPKISIAIINTFMSLMRFVSPVRIQSFVENMPILHHFSADISDFIQYLPKTMPMMKKLPLEFQENILKSLVSACGREPNNYFAISITLLVNHNRQQLIPDLKKYLIRGKLNNAAIWIGQNLFTEKKNFDILDDEGKEFFLSNSFEQLNCNPLNLSLFEYSCKIIAFAMRYSDSNEKLNELKDRLKQSLLPSYQMQFKTALLSIPSDSLESLADDPNEPDSVRSVKLMAIANYFFDHIDDVDADVISEMIYNLKDSNNDLYSTVIDTLSKCINSMFVKCKKQYHIELLKSILSRKNFNWVQDVKVAQLISNVNIDLCRRYIPNYSNTIIDILLEYTISPTDSLFEVSVEVLQKIASYENIPRIIIGIKNSDWITEDVVYKRFYLLANLAELFTLKYFTYFVGIAYESLFFCSNLKTHSILFKFLSLIDVPSFPDNVKQFSFDFIEKYYFIYAHCPIDNNSEFNESTTDFIDFDADIVTNPLIDHKTALDHLKNCYAFLYSLPQNLLQDRERLYKYSIALVPIFDKYALEMAAKLATGNKKAEEFVWNLSIDTFKTTSDDDVAASCCNIFVNDQKILPDFVESMLEQFIGERCTANPELLFLCLLNVDQNNHEKVVEAVPKVLSWLSVKNGTILLFKLVQIIGRDIIPSISDNYGLALLQYANEFGGTYSDSVRKYLQLTDFADVPLNEPTLNENFVTFMENEPMIKLRNPETLDLDHWMFIFDHIFMFDISDMSEYIDTHKSVFAKVNAKSLFNNYYTNIVVRKVPNISKFCSLSPLLSLNFYINEPALIKSFALFSLSPIPNDIFLTLLKYSMKNEKIDVIEALLNYAISTKQKIKFPDFSTQNSDATDNEIYKILFDSRLIHLTATLDIDSVLNFLKIQKDSSLIVNDDIDYKLKLEIINQDPDFYIEYLINYPKFKKKHYLILIQLLMDVQFSIERLSDLIVKYITDYKNLGSFSKKTVFVRFLTSSLYCLRRWNKSNKYKSFINFLSFHFATIVMSADGAILQEYSYLFAFLSMYITEMNFFTEFIKGILTISSAPPLFMITATHLMIKKLIPTISFPDSTFQTILEFELPSYTCSVMKSLSNINIAKDVHLEISSKFESFHFKNNFKCVRYAYNFAKGSDGIFQRFVEVFLSDTSLPCFNECVGCASRSPDTIEKVFNVDFYSPEVVMTMSELLNNKVNCSTYYEKAIAYFMKFPKIETWDIIEKAARSKPNTALNLLYIRIPSKINQFLPFYSNIKRFYLKVDQSTKDKIRNTIEISADAFQIQSRFFALMMIWESDPKTSNLGFIVASNESNDFHSLANKFDKICAKS